MAKLYQKQNIPLQRGTIVQPEKRQDIGVKILTVGAAALDKISKDNFAMGHAGLVDNIINTAYDQNKTNPDGFNEMVKSGLEKSTKNLPGDMRREILLRADTKRRAGLADIKNNIIDAENARYTDNILSQVNAINDGPMGLKSLNDGMMRAFINRDEESGAAYRALWQQQHAKLSALAEARDAKGNYVIGKETERNMYKQGLFGKTDAFRGAIEGLSKEGLKSFDEDIFQNKQHFMEAYGIDFKTYDDMEKLVKARRKAFDAQDKREIKSQDYFTLSQLSAIGEDELADIESRGMVAPETLDLIKTAKKKASKAGANPAAAYNFGDQNEGFLAAIMDLQEVVNSKDDGSPEYSDRLLQAGARADEAITKMYNAGLSEDATQMLRRGLTESIASQDFAAVLDTSDSSFISELTRGAKHDFDSKVAEKEEAIRKKYGPNPNPVQERQMVEELRALPTYSQEGSPFAAARTPRTIAISSNTKKAMNAYASQVFNAAMIEAAKGNYAAAMQIRADGNRELIYMKYGQWIPRHRFEELESDIRNGHKAYITLGNSQYEYLGISQNDIVVKGRF